MPLPRATNQPCTTPPYCLALQLSRDYITELRFNQSAGQESIRGLTGFSREAVQVFTECCPTCAAQRAVKPAKRPATCAIRTYAPFQLWQVCKGRRACRAAGFAGVHTPLQPISLTRLRPPVSLARPQMDLTDLASHRHRSYRYVLIITCRFTKHVWLRPLGSKRSAGIALAVREGCDARLCQRRMPACAF